ncbi:MAG: radical SAM domain-containing protein, partial [Desulfobacterales bacterium CG23_combo_of_CG06-09_8_20_14_all_52_9]
MTAYAFDDLSIVLNREGAREFLKLSVPMRHGRYHEIRTSKHLVQFNLNAEIKYIQGRHRDWPHPSEWLKRTMGNDWVYYSVGSYNDIFDIAGEYYFPCLSYDENPF